MYQLLFLYFIFKNANNTDQKYLNEFYKQSIKNVCMRYKFNNLCENERYFKKGLLEF